MAALWGGVAGRSAPGARAEAEVQVFGQMIVALQTRFGPEAPRSSQVALEVRLLAEGLAAGGRFPVDGRWRPEGSVTGHLAGDRIGVNAEMFTRLCDAFLREAARLVDA